MMRGPNLAPATPRGPMTRGPTVAPATPRGPVMPGARRPTPGTAYDRDPNGRGADACGADGAPFAPPLRPCCWALAAAGTRPIPTTATTGLSIFQGFIPP